MFGNKQEGSNVWMHFSDLITGCLVVFIVITVGLVIKTQGAIVIIGEAEKGIKDSLKVSLVNIEGITIKPDGIIRINSISSNQELFNTNSMESTLYFKQKLDSIYPKFWKIIHDCYCNKEGVKIDIREIRIEGHTDSRGLDFMNIKLSQGRALDVWQYGHSILDSIYFNSDSSFVKYVEGKVVTVGFGENKLLDGKGEMLNRQINLEDMAKSRRVEMSIRLKLLKNEQSED